jgi:hypothetical protein
MALEKRYSKGLLIADIILTFITGGMWLIVVLFRELYRLNGPRRY